MRIQLDWIFAIDAEEGKITRLVVCEGDADFRFRMPLLIDGRVDDMA
jgi:hypothetical protein